MFISPENKITSDSYNFPLKEEPLNKESFIMFIDSTLSFVLLYPEGKWQFIKDKDFPKMKSLIEVAPIN